MVTYISHPTTVEEACRAKQNGAIVYAGGTDFMVRHAKLVQTGQCPPPLFIERVKEFSGISVAATTLRIGALTTMAEMSVHEDIPELLAKACNCVGSPALRNVATIGGNICTASPAGDSLPALYAMDALVEICSPEGMHTLPIYDFIIGPGQTKLTTNELLSAVIIPKRKSHFFYHRKVSSRVANAITKVSLAVVAIIENEQVQEMRIAYGSVGPTIICCPNIERVCKHQSLAQLVEMVPQLLTMVETTVNPIDDYRSTALYRRSIASNLLEECFEKLLQPVNFLDL